MSDEISVGDLVVMIAKLIGVKVEVNADQQRIRPDKSEVERLFCNNSKILENTSWKPEYSLESGLQETIEWIKNNMSYFKSDIYNV